MNFEDALKLNGLDTMIESRWGRWGHISKEAADYCWQAAGLEAKPERPVHTLAAMLLFTMAEEASFHLDVMPNDNGHKDDPGRWDYGPMQINDFWLTKALQMHAYTEVEGWRGSAIPNNPQPFDGDILANVRMGARYILAYHGAVEEQIVHYTGPDHQVIRRHDWQLFGQPMTYFYQKYDEA